MILYEYQLAHWKIEFCQEEPTTVTDRVFEECVEDGSLEFYRWFLKAFYVNGNFTPIYRNALLDHIQCTEELLYSPNFRDLCCKTVVDMRVDRARISRYADWLVRIGRARLFPEVIVSLIEPLLDDATRDSVELLLLSIVAMPRVQQSESLARLLRLASTLQCQSQEVHLNLLLSLMTRTGLLAGELSQDAISQLENGESDLVPRLLELSCGGVDIDSRTGMMRMLLNILKTTSSITSSLVTSLRLRLYGLEKQLAGVILRITAERKLGIFESAQMILPSITIDMDDSFFMEVTWTVYCHGDFFIIEKYHAEVMGLASPRLEVLYTRVLKSILQFEVDKVNKDWCLMGNAGIFAVERLGKDADLQIFLTMCSRGWTVPLLRVVTREIRRRIADGEELQDFADKLISRYVMSTHLEETPGTEEVIEFSGKHTVRLLLQREPPYSSLLRACVDKYVKSDPRHCVNLLIETFTPGSNLLDSAPWSLCFNYRGPRRTLVLGSRAYQQDHETPGRVFLINSDDIKTSEWDMQCGVCQERMSEGIFHEPNANHGDNTCVACRSEEATAIACGVCLCDDKYLDLRVVTCGHVFCKECLSRLRPIDVAACPICRRSIRVDRKRLSISITKAATLFWEEWSASPSAAEEASHRVSAEIQPDPEEETSSSEDSS